MRESISNTLSLALVFLISINGWSQCSLDVPLEHTIGVCLGNSVLTLPVDDAPSGYSFSWEIFDEGEWVNVETGTPSGAVYDQGTVSVLSITGLNITDSLSYRAIIDSDDDCDGLSIDFEILTIATPNVDFSCIEDQYCSGEPVICEFGNELNGWEITGLDLSEIPGVEITIPQELSSSFEFTVNNNTLERKLIELDLSLEKDECQTNFTQSFYVNPIPEITVNSQENACTNTELEITIENDMLEEVQVETSFVDEGFQHSLADTLVTIPESSFITLLDSTFEAGSGISFLNIVVSPFINGCEGSSQELSITLGQVSSQIELSTDSICSGSMLEVSISGDESSEFVLNELLEDSETQYELNDATFNLMSQDVSIQTIEFILTESIFLDDLLICEAESDQAEVIGIRTPIISPDFESQICSASILEIINAGEQNEFVSYSRPTETVGVDFLSAESGDLPYADAPVNTSNTIAEVLFDLEANNLGCLAEQSITIDVIPQDLTDVPESLTVCDNESFQVEFSAEIESANISFERIDQPNYSSTQPSNGQNAIFDQLNNLTNDTILVHYEVKTIYEGCTTDIDTFTVFLLPPLMLDTVDLNLYQCEGDTVMVELHANSEEATIFWSRETNINFEPQEASAQGNIEEVVENVSGVEQTLEYQVFLQQNQCTSDTLFIEVELTNGPDLIVSEDEVLCPGDDVQLFAAGGFSYEWFPSVNMNFPYVQDPIASPQETTVYTVIGTGLNGCSNREEITIEVLSNPGIIGLNEFYEICTEDLIEFGFENEELLSELSVSNGSASVVAGNLQVEPFQNGEITIFIESEDGCLTQYSTNVNLLSTPPASINGPQDVCQGSSYTLFNVPISNSEFSWNVENGEIIAGGSGSAIWVEWNGSSGLGMINLQVIAENGCLANSSFEVNISDDLAPLLEPISQITEGLLGVSEGYDFYTWGKEDIYTLESEYTCQGISYCFFEEIDDLNFNYFVEYGNYEECMNRSYFLPPVLGIEDNREEVEFVLFPNPLVQDYVHIKSNSSMRAFVLFDSVGRRITEGPLTGVYEGVIDLKKTGGSLAILVIDFMNGQQKAYKLIISD